MYDWLEAQILYLLLRAVRPRVVAEISPGTGYTSGFILLALNANGHGELHSFDRRPDACARSRAAFRAAGIDDARRTFHLGDARATAPAALDGVDVDVDVLFLDSDHSAPFAEWYVTELFPRVRDDGLVHVHDVLPRGRQPHHGNDLGEGRVVWEHVTSACSAREYVYVSELVGETGDVAGLGLARYPFADRSIGCDGVEQNPSLWLVNRRDRSRPAATGGGGSARPTTGPGP